MTLQGRLRDYINDIDDCRLRLEAANQIDELEKHNASLQHQIDAGQDQTRRLGEVIEWHQKDALELQAKIDNSEGFYEKVWKQFLSLQTGNVRQIAVMSSRYMWLRDEANQTREDTPCVSNDTFQTFFGEELDAMIDAELMKEKP